MPQSIENEFFRWTDSVLAGALPEGVAAFSFNLYEAPTSHEIELIGAPSFDPENPDWACDDIFVSAPPRFELAHGVTGPGWEAGLTAAAELIRRYLASHHSGAAVLRSTQAVAVGFVDGDLKVIWAAP